MVIICINRAEFDAIDTRVLDGLKSDREGFSADNATIPIEHPTDGRVIFTVDKDWLKYLTDDEKDRQVKLPADWFSEEEI